MIRNPGWHARVFALLVMCVFAVAFFSGCRGLSGSDDESQGVYLDTETLEGNVTMPAVPNIVADEVISETPDASIRAADLAGGVNVPNALVWIEELPNVPAQRTTATGSYRFTGLPPGTYHIIVKYEQSGKTFKVRSAPAQAQPPGPNAKTFPLQLGLARKMITGVLRDSSGKVLSAGTIIKLWGEEFKVQANGVFTAGPLPDSITDAELVIVQTGVSLANAPRIPVQVLTTDRPTTIEIQIPGTSNQVPPIGASFTAKKGGQPVSSSNTVKPGDQVTITLTLTNIIRTTTGITFEWDPGRGSFSPAPGNNDSAVWVAPSTGLATVSVKISAPNRGFCRVNLLMVVGSAQVSNVTVSFNAQGGSSVAAKTVAQGEKITTPAAPTRNGYTFAGWYKESGCTNAWNFNTDIVSANLTLYAKWLAGVVPSYTVTFNVYGGSSVAAQTIVSGGKATTPTPPTKDGFTFVGWYKDAAFSLLWSFGVDTVTAATTLHAKWVANTVPTSQVTFNSQGGTNVDSQTVETGGKATTPTPPTKNGFTFAGWYKESGCTNVWNFSTETINANKELFAKWVANAAPICTVTYTAGANGSISGTTPQLISQGANGTTVTAVAAAGYQFVKWDDNSTANPRTDTNVTATMTYTASFAAIEGAIAGDNKYAWSENSGWINFAPTNGGVGSKRGANGYLNGFAWSESLGWIKFAATGAVAPFVNNAANNWGVNVAADGTLSGYAWSENSGWINFGATGGNAAMNQTTGELSGFAWSESAGWIHLAGTGYKVQFGS